MNDRTKKNTSPISEANIRIMINLLADCYFNYYQVRLSPVPYDESKNQFIKEVAEASNKDVIPASALANVPIKEEKALALIHAETFSKLAEFFGPDLKPRFLTAEQKAVLSTIAAVTMASIAQIKSPQSNTDLSVGKTQAFQPTLGNGLPNQESGSPRWDIFCKLMGDFKWEAIGQTVSSASLLTSIPYKQGTLLVIHGSRMLTLAAAVSPFLILLEGGYLFNKIDKKNIEWQAKEYELELFRTNYLATRQGNPAHDLDFTKRCDQFTEELKVIEFELNELKARRKYIYACLFVAVSATVLSSVFSGGMLPLAIGVGAMVISLILEGLEYKEAYDNRVKTDKRITADKSEMVTPDSDNSQEDLEGLTFEEADDPKASDSQVYDLDRDALDPDDPDDFNPDGSVTSSI